jgi:hypothetical protein
VLGAQQQLPPPGAHEQHHQIQAERHRDPQRRLRFESGATSWRRRCERTAGRAGRR